MLVFDLINHQDSKKARHGSSPQMLRITVGYQDIRIKGPNPYLILRDLRTYWSRSFVLLQAHVIKVVCKKV